MGFSKRKDQCLAILRNPEGNYFPIF